MKSAFFSKKSWKVAIVLGFICVAWGLAIAQEKSSASKKPTILPNPPLSDERWAFIESFKKRAPEHTQQFAAFTYCNAQGEVMPYRLFQPHRLESGRKYPLVVFLHGASGSGTDNEKQLQLANWFGGLVWVLPENQERFPCFVVAPQSNVNWPCVIIEEGKRPQRIHVGLHRACASGVAFHAAPMTLLIRSFDGEDPSLPALLAFLYAPVY